MSTQDNSSEAEPEVPNESAKPLDLPEEADLTKAPIEQKTTALEDDNPVSNDNIDNGPMGEGKKISSSITAIGNNLATASPRENGPLKTDAKGDLSTSENNAKLSDNQKNEVKTLLKVELEASTNSVKEQIAKDLQDTKKDFLTFFGLFTSFVTFLSIEVQLFKNKENIQELLGTSFLSLALVAFFVILLSDIGREKHSYKELWKPSYMLTVVFLIVGTIFLFWGGKREINTIKKLEARALKDSVAIINLRQELKNYSSKIEDIDSLLTKNSIHSK